MSTFWWSFIVILNKSARFCLNILGDTVILTLNRPRGAESAPAQAGSFLCYDETVSNRKLKLCDFYYILIGLNSEYKPVPWDIHCCHGNAIIEWCSVKFSLKSVENCYFLLKLFSNFNLGLLFVISISKLPLCQISSKSDKNKEVRIFYFFTRMEPKIQDYIIKTS